MSHVAVRQLTSSHSLGRGHPHDPRQSQHSMTDMPPRSSILVHESYVPRSYPSPPELSQPHPRQQLAPPQCSPTSNLASPLHHGRSLHAYHLPPPPSPMAGRNARGPPLGLNTHYQYSDPYSTPSPVGSAPSPRFLLPPGPRPVAPASDAYSPAPIGDIRQLSPTRSSSSSSADEENWLKQLQQRQSARAGLTLNTRQLPPPPPPPPPSAQTLSSPTSARWSPTRHEGKMNISDLLLSDAPSEAQQPQAPIGMPLTPLSAPPVPSANSRPSSAKANRTAIRSPSSILRPGKGPYSIRVRQQPVAARSCGFGERDRRVIDPPPIVQLSVNDPSLDPEEVSRIIRDTFSVVHCSIYDQTGSQDSSSMPEEHRQQRRLMGTMVASPFVGIEENGEEGCFFCFPDLSCRTPGAFRLKFNLVVLDPAKMMPGNASPIRASAMSDVFIVYHAKDFPGMQASTPLAKRLKEQGCLISIRKGNERTKVRGREETDEDEEEEGNGRRKKARKN